MSVRWREPLIVRSINGELSPHGEARLRRHLRRCAECAKRYEQLENVTRFLGQAPNGTRIEKERARTSLQGSLDDEVGRSAARRTMPWLLGGAGVALAAAAFVIVSFSKKPSLDRRAAAINTSALPQTQKVDALAIPVVAHVPNDDASEFKPPFEGEPPQYQPWQVIRTFDFEGARRRHPEWRKGTVMRCPAAETGTRCISAWRALPCCPYAGQVTWANFTKGGKIFSYSEDLLVTFRYWTGASTSLEPLDMQLQVMDAAAHHFSFPFKAKARAAWQKVTIPLSWLRSNPGIMVGIKVAKPGPSMPIPEGAAIRSLQVMLRYSREDVLLVDDVELVRFSEAKRHEQQH